MNCIQPVKEQNNTRGLFEMIRTDRGYFTNINSICDYEWVLDSLRRANFFRGVTIDIQTAMRVSVIRTLCYRSPMWKCNNPGFLYSCNS